MTFDKYRAMQKFVMRIASLDPLCLGGAFGADILAMIQQAKDILAGMEMPRGPDIRARERRIELEALAFAYGVIIHVGAPDTINHRAASITLEALKAWERDHVPAPLDPLLL